MKNKLGLSMKISSLALAATLAACGGGGGSPAPSAVLAPGIWNKTDNTQSTTTTKFVGVVTTASNGSGNVWGVTSTFANANDAMPLSVKVFTGPVTASGENYATSQGTVLSFTGVFEPAQAGQPLTLPKSTSAQTQRFDFGSGAVYETSVDTRWSTAATIDATDWTGTWTRQETVNGANVTHTLRVNGAGEISGDKKSGDNLLCNITGNVTRLERAVVNVTMTRNCNGTSTTYNGISFPELVDGQNRVTARAIWLRGAGSISNDFEIKPYYRQP